MIKINKLFVVCPVFGVLILTGCTTIPKPTLTANQCQSVNWRQLGYQDGLLGRSADFVEKHRQACATVNLSINVDEWRQGRVEGLKSYCTPLRAYQLGREGFDFNPVCPSEQTLELLKSHDEGYRFYQQEQLYQQMWYHDWSPFGWHRPYYSPFYGYPHHVKPRSLPPYVNLDKK